jgi:hypothetical protein
MNLPIHTSADAADTLAVVDALYRFAAGQDLRDEALFASAFAEDAELDFTQPARRLGVDLPVFRGRSHIVGTILATLSRLDTTHTVTTPRVQIEGDEAQLLALVEAQHLPRDDHSRHLLLKNLYRLRLRRDGRGWRITHMLIETVWRSGDPAVLFG